MHVRKNGIITNLSRKKRDMLGTRVYRALHSSLFALLVACKLLPSLNQSNILVLRNDLQIIIVIDLSCGTLAVT
jgi:hypothetical protein